MLFKVAFGKNALLALVGGLVVAVALIAFLLGRETTRPTAPAQTAYAPVERPGVGRDAPVPAAAPEKAPSGDGGEVAQYFTRMQEIQVGENRIFMIHDGAPEPPPPSPRDDVTRIQAPSFLPPPVAGTGAGRRLS